MALSIYKKGQGNYTRLGSAFCLGIISAIACYKLYNILTDISWFQGSTRGELIGSLIPVAVFGIIAFLIYRLVNKQSVADFMIASEGEMKKVSWSSRQEIIASTVIVIIVMALMAALLGVTDVIFTIIFKDVILK